MPRTIAAIHPNAGLTAAYKRRLVAWVDAMHRSLAHWLLAAYRAHPPILVASDEVAAAPPPARHLIAEMGKLGGRWEQRIEQAAPKLAEWFATAAVARTDHALATTLRTAGMTVRFAPTPAVRTIFAATVDAQVGLITSIAAEHVAGVRGAVMRSVQTGRDVGALARELEDQFGVTTQRAATIARHQNNMATATINRARQAELGITTALWLHSGGGRHPRPEHVAMSGKPYEIARGAFLEGEWVWPGTAINCRCVSKSIIPGL